MWNDPKTAEFLKRAEEAAPAPNPQGWPNWEKAPSVWDWAERPEDAPAQAMAEFPKIPPAPIINVSTRPNVFGMLPLKTIAICLTVIALSIAGSHKAPASTCAPANAPAIEAAK